MGAIRDEGIYWVGSQPVFLTRKKVRYLRLRLSPDGQFHLSIPWGVSRRRAEKFLAAQEEWMTARLQSRQNRQVQETRLENGTKIAWWGAEKQLRLVTIATKTRARARIAGAYIELEAPADADDEARRRALDKLRRDSLETRLQPLLLKWSQSFGVDVRQVRLRRMRTRWGSCNPRTHALTFNLELTKYDPKYLDYVVAHEMTHFFHANHGADFHARLSSKLPAERALHRELNRLARES